jgi:putative drug exporter of the RND superfamily
MTSTATRRHARTFDRAPDRRYEPGLRPGLLGRLGVWVTDHAKAVAGVWLLLIIGLAPSRS